ncbi:MAG: [citrate (pro-3S)-lyase] ligase [Treponema sp.]|nr:[citrate (pro-3S)-lyase] ligase [Treponema sp.]
MSEYERKIGTPFHSVELERLKQFLTQESLAYDERITYTVVFEDGDEIVATGSCEANILKCIAVAPRVQGQNVLALVVSDLVQHLADNGIFHYFGFTKPEHKTVFKYMGLYPVAETERVLLLENKRGGFSSYVQSLCAETANAKAHGKENEHGVGIGAIIANCNPFTFGHRYLIERAASECRWVHVFVLSAEQGWLRAQDRFNMVQAGTSDLQNVILHVTSDYLISPVVFPTYFITEKDKAFSINCMLDVKIFCEHIAKSLEITKRYIGTEPSNTVTREYNRILKEALPKAGIDVIELPRLALHGNTVSASSVRSAIADGNFDSITYMLPETTRAYLQSVGAVHALP